LLVGGAIAGSFLPPLRRHQAELFILTPLFFAATVAVAIWVHHQNWVQALWLAVMAAIIGVRLYRRFKAFRRNHLSGGGYA